MALLNVIVACVNAFEHNNNSEGKILSEKQDKFHTEHYPLLL